MIAKSQNNIDTLCESLKYLSISDSSEYYFVLGQFVMYIFYSLGNVNNYNREINYLTNPVVKQSIYNLAKRNLRFIKNYSILIKQKNSFVELVYEVLIQKSQKYITPLVDTSKCEQSFYEGIYAPNFLIDCAKIYNEL